MFRQTNSAAQRLPYFDYFRWDGNVEQLPSTLRKLLGTQGYQHLQASYGSRKDERNAHTGRSIGEKMKMWRSGFYAESATIYDLPRNDPEDYLSDYQHLMM